MSPWRTTTAPEACLAILPVSNEISLPAISTETVVTASVCSYVIPFRAALVGRRDRRRVSSESEHDPGLARQAARSLVRGPSASNSGRRRRRPPPPGASRTSRRTRAAASSPRGGRPRSGRGRARAPRARPQVRVVEAALVGVQRVVERPRTRPGSAAASAACASATARGCLAFSAKWRKTAARARPRAAARGATAQRGQAKSRVDDHERPVRRRRGRGRRRAGAGSGALRRSLIRSTVMMRIHTAASASRLPRDARESVFAFFADARNLEAITPPLLRFAVVTPGAGRDGRRRRSSSTACACTACRSRWLTRSIQDWEPPHRFVDEQVRGPYRAVAPHPRAARRRRAGGTLMRDTVRYALGLRPARRARPPRARARATSRRSSTTARGARRRQLLS